MRTIWTVLLVLTAAAFAYPKIEEAQQTFPIQGIKGEGRKGDYLICNEKVTFVVEKKPQSSGYGFFPGNVIDAGFTLKGKGCLGEKNQLGEVFPALNPGKINQVRGFKAESFEIVQNEPGKAAILRVKGKDEAVAIVEEFLGTKANPLGLELIVDYILEPGASYLTQRYQFSNLTEEKMSIALGYAYILGDGLRVAGEGIGFDAEQLDRRFMEYLSAIGDQIAYSWYAPDNAFKVALQYSGVFFGFFRKVRVPAGGTTSLDVQLHVTPPDLGSALASMGRKGEFPVAGKVTEGGGKPVAGARVYAVAGEDVASMAVTDSQGNYQLDLKAGEYHFYVVANRRLPVTQKMRIEGGRKLDFSLEPPSALEIEVKEEKKGAIPAMLTFERSEPVKLPAVIGEKRDTRFDDVVFLLPGKNTVPVLPGKYAVSASRGFEYEYAKQDMTFDPGKTQRWNPTLKRSVNTAGYLSGDFHLHALPSPDSNDPLEDKIMGLAAHHVEVPVATDHNVVTDYLPTIKKLKLEKFLTRIIGDELTTIKYGHFNVFPLPYDENLPNNGAPQWWGIGPKEIFANVRSIPTNPVIQVNHPRSGVGGGYFSSVELDPQSCQVQYPQFWSEDFDLIEIFNGKRVSQLNETYPDWFMFINAGKKKTATGTSDSHHIYGIEAGYPRSYVFTGTDTVERFEEASFMKAVRDQRVMVSGGPFIDFRIGDKLLGDLAPAAGGKVELHIRVESPSWMPLTKLTIYRNGEPVKAIPLKETKDAVKFDDKVTVDVAKDSWFFVAAEGTASLAPVYPGAQPYGFTNPIYVDANGDGKFTPPKPCPTAN